MSRRTKSLAFILLTTFVISGFLLFLSRNQIPNVPTLYLEVDKVGNFRGFGPATIHSFLGDHHILVSVTLPKKEFRLFRQGGEDDGELLSKLKSFIPKKRGLMFNLNGLYEPSKAEVSLCFEEDLFVRSELSENELLLTIGPHLKLQKGEMPEEGLRKLLATTSGPTYQSPGSVLPEATASLEDAAKLLEKNAECGLYLPKGIAPRAFRTTVYANERVVAASLEVWPTQVTMEGGTLYVFKASEFGENALISLFDSTSSSQDQYDYRLYGIPSARCIPGWAGIISVWGDTTIHVEEDGSISVPHYQIVGRNTNSQFEKFRYKSKK